MKKDKQNKIQLEFVVMIGLPCSGKSTLANSEKYKNHIVVSIDDMLMLLNPSVSYNEAYNKINTACVYCDMRHAERLFKATFLRLVKEGRYSLIIDKTNLTSKSRKRLLATVPSEYKKIAMIFDWDMKVLKERNAKRAKETGKFISEKVLQDMNEMFVPIKADEGFDKVVQIRLK